MKSNTRSDLLFLVLESASFINAGVILTMSFKLEGSN